MRDNAEDTLASTDISIVLIGGGPQPWSPSLTLFFQVRKNIIFERARFIRRNQEEGKSTEQFITNLYSLTDNCAFGDLKNIVVGVCDKALSERLQLDLDLTLEKAKKIVWQREAVLEQNQILKSGSRQEKLVDSWCSEAEKLTMGERCPKEACIPRGPRSRSHQQPQVRSTDVLGTGKLPMPGTCVQPKTQSACKRKGHFSSHCFSKSITDVSSTTEPTDEHYDTALHHLPINGQDAPFKLDTGAEVTVISEKVLASLSSPKLHRPTKRLCGPDWKPLDVTCDTILQGRSCTQPAYAVRELQHNLLGLPAIQALKLLTQVNTLEKTPVPQQFPRY